MESRIIGAPVAATLGAAAFLLAGPAAALEAGDWLIRVRAIGVLPTDDSGGIKPDLLGAGIEAQPAAMPELDITYMATDQIGLELILATTPHDADGKGAIAGLGKVADAWLLPPTLLVQWHFIPGGSFHPYVGAGINWTITYGESASGSLKAALGPTQVHMGNSVGFALQAGADYDINDRWFVNFDVKYIDLDVDTKLVSGAVTRRTNLEINPVIVGFGVGYRF